VNREIWATFSKELLELRRRRSRRGAGSRIRAVSYVGDLTAPGNVLDPDSAHHQRISREVAVTVGAWRDAYGDSVADLVKNAERCARNVEWRTSRIRPAKNQPFRLATSIDWAIGCSAAGKIQAYASRTHRWNAQFLLPGGRVSLGGLLEQYADTMSFIGLVCPAVAQADNAILIRLRTRSPESHALRRAERR